MAPMTEENGGRATVEQDLRDAIADRRTAPPAPGGTPAIWDNVGLLAFILASVLGSSFLLLTGLGINFAMPDWVRLRTVELFAMYSAIGVLAAVLIRTRNLAMQAFLVFVLAALIIPTKDVVSFALLATGSDRSADQFADSEDAIEIGVEFQRESRDLANAITDSLYSNGYVGEAPRSAVVSAVEFEINVGRTQGQLNRVNLEGTMDTLLAVGNGTYADYLQRFGNGGDLQADLGKLGRQQLVRFTPDFLNASLTPQGVQVLCLDSFSALDYSNKIAECFSNSNAALRIPDRFGTSPVDAVIDETLANCAAFERQATDLTGEDRVRPQTYQRFELDERSRVDIALQSVSAPGEFDQDPFLVLFRVEDDACEYVDRNDDAEGLNARLQLVLPEGDYLVLSTVFSSGRGEMLLIYEAVPLGVTPASAPAE